MKRLIFALSISTQLLLMSCESWIDVLPKTEVKSKEIFSNEAGFKSALIGIYARMTQDETYGKNLSYGYIEELTHRYDNYHTGIIPTDEQRAEIYDYRNHAYSKNIQSTIWKEMYKTIANINNLIYNIELSGDEILITPNYREIIAGEAYALRAFHYFDLLRLWGPTYSLDPTSKTLPWRNTVGNEKIELSAANDLIEHIISDLKKAEQLLSNDNMNYERDNENIFLSKRGFRLNLFAVKALLARVYNYTGDKENAIRYASEVISSSKLTLVNNNSVDAPFSKEALFSINVHNMVEHIMNDWKNTVTLDTERWISTDNIRTVYEYSTIGVNDIRYRSGYGFIHGSGRYLNRKFLSSDLNYQNIIPMIRLSEMYLIMAESVALGESYTYLNTLRTTRGISRNNNIGSSITEEQRESYINKEYQKEFFAEGQWFYYLKRKNKNTFHRSPVENMIYYRLPIPDDEVEFGNVNQ